MYGDFQKLSLSVLLVFPCTHSYRSPLICILVIICIHLTFIYLVPFKSGHKIHKHKNKYFKIQSYYTHGVVQLLSVFNFRKCVTLYKKKIHGKNYDQPLDYPFLAFQ